LDDIQTCLKPGGIFILIDATGEILAKDGMRLRRKSRRHPEGSRLRRLFYEVYCANIDQGSDETMMLATLDEGLWDCTDLVECRAAELRIPIGPWVTDAHDPEARMLRDAGRIMQQLLLNILRGHEFALRQLGFDERVMQKWHNEIMQELQDENIKRSLDIRILWGRRKGGQRLSFVSPPVDPHHRYLRVCKQPESWKKMLERRMPVGTGPPEHITPFVYKICESPVTPTNGRRLS